MKHIPGLPQLLILMFFGATVALPETEEEIPLSEVPKEIIAAAQEAVPGIELTEAEVEKTDKGLVNGQSFSSGHFYLEKDWGRSFPQAWIWMQSNNFTQPASLCCSVARVPFRGRVFTGFIVGVWAGGSLHRFATYTGAKIDHISCEQSSVQVIVSQVRQRLELRARRQPGVELASPIEGVMKGRIKETLRAEIEVRLTDRRTIIPEDVGHWAGLQVIRPGHLDIREQQLLLFRPFSSSIYCARLVTPTQTKSIKILLLN